MGGQGFQPVQDRQMKAGVDQVVAMLGQDPGQPGPVLLAHDLGDGVLYVAMFQQPGHCLAPQGFRPGRVGVAQPLHQRIPEQVVVAEPFVAGIQGDQEQVLAQQLLQDFLAVVPAPEGVAEGRGQAGQQAVCSRKSASLDGCCCRTSVST